MGTKFNPFTGTFDLTGAAPGFIPEYTADPVSPEPETSWVLKSEVMTGTPIGLLLALTQEIDVGDSYQFSYKTLEGPIVRTGLT